MQKKKEEEEGIKKNYDSCSGKKAIKPNKPDSEWAHTLGLERLQRS